MNPEFLFSKSEVCPKFVQSKNGTIFNLSGQYLDNICICLSNLCPSVSELGRGSTELGLYFDGASTNSLHDLFLDSHWTVIGQGLDKDWILRPVSVQPTIGYLYRLFLPREMACSFIAIAAMHVILI